MRTLIASFAFTAACGNTVQTAPDQPDATPQQPMPDAAPASTPDAPAATAIDCDGAAAPRLAANGPFHSIRVHASGGMIIGPGTLAGDGAGNLYMSHYGIEGAIRITPTGQMSTVALFDTTAFCSDAQLVRDSAGGFYIWNHARDMMMKYASGASSDFSTAGGLTGTMACGAIAVTGMAYDGNQFFLGSEVNNAVYRLSPDGQSRTTLATVTFPWHLDADGTGGVYAVTGAGGLAHVLATGQVVPLGSGLYSARHDPHDGMVYASAGHEATQIVKVAGAGDNPQVAACFPGSINDLWIDRASNGTGTSLYAMVSGGTPVINAIYELKR